MKVHEIRVAPAATPLAAADQLAWKIAAMAADAAPIDVDAAEMAISRIIDNAGVALAAINRRPAANARSQTLAHPRAGGASVFGVSSDRRFDCEWAAWTNATAVRELDFHDYFGGLESGHPGDTIPPIIAAAEQCGCGGESVIRGILTAYETQIDLAKGIHLKAHGIEHLAHAGPAVAAGLGALLGLDTETIYQAVQHAAQVSISTRQTRRGTISSWKAFAPGHVGKLAIEAVDRAMRGEQSPSPIYEGAEGIIAKLLDGPDAVYHVPLPEPGEPKRAILDTFTKEHSIGYHGQAIVDLAIKMRDKVKNLDDIESVVLHTKRYTHNVMGNGSNDPQKYDPTTSRESLDHSAMFAFAVALEDGAWHHISSYLPERVGRPDTVKLWRKVRTVEDEEWNRRYDDRPSLERDHGARAVVTYKSGERITDELAVANAHPRGARPFGRPEYVRKFQTLVEDIVDADESARFLGTVQRLTELSPGEIHGLNIAVDPGKLECAARDSRGIF